MSQLSGKTAGKKAAWKKLEAETAAAWKEIEEERARQIAEDYEAEACPCGHKHHQHWGGGEGHCEVPGCGCQEFGTEVQEDEAHEVNLGDSPGGFKIYE